MYKDVGHISLNRVQGYAELIDRHLELDKGAPVPLGSIMTAHQPTEALLLGHLFDVLPAPWLNCHVIGLYPSQQIVAHADNPIQGIRYHLVLQQNPGCWSLHDGTWQQLELGHLYTMDPSLEHGAVNWGAQMRLHLIVDQA